MIELIAKNGTRLPVEGQIVTREKESTLFKRDVEVTEFTYPFDIAMTDEAIVALGSPNVLATADLGAEHEVSMVVDGVMNYNVILKVLKVSQKKRMASCTILGEYASLAKVFADRKLDSLELDGTRTIGAPGIVRPILINSLGKNTIQVEYTDCTTATHIGQVVRGEVAADYQFAPGYDWGDNESDLKLTPTFQLQEFGVMLNAWVDDGGDGFAPDPVFDYLKVLESGNTWGPPRRIWTPFFKMIYVFRKCWEEFGFKVTGEFLTNPEMQKPLLYNTYAINRCRIEKISPVWVKIHHEAFTITPGNHMPDMTIMDFLLEVGKAFNLEYVTDIASRTVHVRYVDLRPDKRAVVDLSHVADPDCEISNEDAEYKKGYSFEFEWDMADGFSGEEAEELAYETNRAYPFTQEMRSYRTAEADDLVSIKTKLVPMENVFANFRWNNGFSFSSHFIAPVMSQITVCGAALLTIGIPGYTMGLPGHDLPAGVPGAEFLTVDLPKAPFAPHLINWHGILEYPVKALWLDIVKHLPTATSHNLHPMTGAWLKGEALVWKTENKDGYYDLRWKHFTDAIKDSPQAEYEVLMDADIYSRYDLFKCIVKIDGLHFLLKKDSVSMPFPSVAKMTLVRI